VFGSELKALRMHPDFRPNVDRHSLALLMRHNYVPAPYSIYEGIRKQSPGTLLTISPGRRDVHTESYWDARAAIASGLSNPFRGSPEEAVEELDHRLRTSVQGQMVADVPLGAFLSGGIDSSTVVATMQSMSTRRVKTFSIGFHESDYNEANHAKAVAQHLNTDHTELYVEPEQALDVIPRLPALYDEPFADSSQVPTFLVSQLAREHVTVSLSGDAGDELFGGYNRYALGDRVWRRLTLLPTPVRASAARALASVPPERWQRLLGRIASRLPGSLAQANVGDKIAKAAAVLGARSSAELYLLLVSHWSDPTSVVRDATEPITVLTDPASRPATDCLVHEMMALDLLTYLPDDILVKVDRAAMGVSLESRIPFLDHRIIEFAWQLPLAYKLRHGVTKWPIREILYRHVPKQLIERPKMGFGVPIDAWLRGPLREWAESLLDEALLKKQGYFRAPPIRQKWIEHLSGTRNWQYHLWNVLMFQSWLCHQA
jgi:asparagine synthase (glutamine-hydrolysing)